jgi:hypothetical protein
MRRWNKLFGYNRAQVWNHLIRDRVRDGIEEKNIHTTTCLKRDAELVDSRVLSSQNRVFESCEDLYYGVRARKASADVRSFSFDRIASIARPAACSSAAKAPSRRG